MRIFTIFQDMWGCFKICDNILGYVLYFWIVANIWACLGIFGDIWGFWGIFIHHVHQLMLLIHAVRGSEGVRAIRGAWFEGLKESVPSGGRDLRVWRSARHYGSVIRGSEGVRAIRGRDLRVRGSARQYGGVLRGPEGVHAIRRRDLRVWRSVRYYGCVIRGSEGVRAIRGGDLASSQFWLIFLQHDFKQFESCRILSCSFLTPLFLRQDSNQFEPCKLRSDVRSQSFLSIFTPLPPTFE